MNLHRIIFWSHLLAGTIAGLVIFLMSSTGVLLMYAPQILAFAERQVRQVARPTPDAKQLSLDAVITKTRETNPEVRLTGLMLRSDPTAAVSIGFGREGGALYIDPYTGRVLGQGSKIRDWLHGVEDWHRWLGMDGENRTIGKGISGVCNIAFLWLAITGVYLRWPRSWKWRGLKTSLLFNPRLRGKARDWNWHNVIGFWCSTVLIILTLTAAVMSYNWANDLLYTLTGNEPPRRVEGPASIVQQTSGPARQKKEEPGPRKPSASLDALLVRAQQQVPGWVVIMMRFSPRGDGPVTAFIQEPDAWHPFQRSQLTLDRATAEVVKWEPYSNNNAGRKLRTWVRALHTGEAFGPAGQTVAGTASLGGCFLVWTGLAMAWRRLRSWRREAADPSVTQPVTFADSSLVEISQGLQLEGEKSSMAPEILSEESSQLGHSGDRNGAATHRLETMKNYSTRDSVLILFGTVTGNAESLAQRMAGIIAREGFHVRVKDMAHYTADALSQENCVFIITSTYGNGEPPDDAAPFWERVVRRDGLNLSGVKFSVLALGNSTYDHFCKCGRDLDAALERHGATRFYPRVDCDVDYDLPAKRWTDGVLARLQRDHGASAAA